MSESSIVTACRERREREIKDINALRDKGRKTVGYLCHFFPDAVAAGLGLIPVRLDCGVSGDTESAGERHIRPDACPLVKSTIGNISSNKSPHSDMDIWLGLLTCDQMRRAMFMLGDEFGLEMHPVQLPATRTSLSYDYYSSQITRFADDLSSMHGLRFDPEKALMWHYEKKLASDVLMRISNGFVLSPIELHHMFHLYFVSRPSGLAAFIENKASQSSFNPAARVILAGGPVAFEDTALLETLTEAGVGVMPVNCTGINALHGLLNGGIHDMIDTLSFESFHRPPCARHRPNNEVFDNIGRSIKETGASGVIVKSLKFCDHWYAERKRLSESFGVPVLFIETTYAEGGRERQASRIEAFVELLAVSGTKTTKMSCLAKDE